MGHKTDTQTRYALAVIGCGLTGTSLLYQFVRRVKAHLHQTASTLKPFKIIVFEQNSDLGPGLPYQKDNLLPFHLINMPAADMSITQDFPDDFIHWYAKSRSRLEQYFPSLIPYLPREPLPHSSDLFLPRMVMGEYLKNRLDDALETAAALGIQVVIQKRTTVIDIKEKTSHLCIVSDQQTEGSQETVAERVFLATGHWFDKSRQNRYFASPWPAQTLLAKIPEGSKVGVIGTRLSAIDTALTLLSDGCFSRNPSGKLTFSKASGSRQVTLYSRSGLLPKVRGRTGSYRNQFFSISSLCSLIAVKKEKLLLENLFQLLNRELETGYQKPVDWNRVLHPSEPCLSILDQDIHMAREGDNPDGDILWQTILFQVIPLMKQLYINLIPSHRHWFETRFKSVFMTHVSVIPLINAEKIQALMQARVLTVKKLGNTYECRPLIKSNGFEIIFSDPDGKQICDTCHFMVDARGQSASYRTNPSDLARNMLASGLVQIETCQVDEHSPPKNHSSGRQKTIETGSLWIDPKTCRVMKKSGQQAISTSNRLFAFGIMNQGQIINASMAKECVIRADLAAGHILDDMLKIH